MNHEFTESAADKTRCRCGRSESDHSIYATCDACGNTCGIDAEIHGERNLLLCQECFAKEVEAYKAVKELQTPASEILQVSRKIDQTVKIKEDLFNAKTKAIVELEAVIVADASITNKHFTLCKAVEERFNHLTELLHDWKSKQEDALVEQRALQTFFQMRAQQLSIEEREKIKLKDLNYKPEPPKLLKKAPPVKKFDMHALKFVAQQTGFPLGVLQTICLNRNVQPVEAARILKELQGK